MIPFKAVLKNLRYVRWRKEKHNENLAKMRNAEEPWWETQQGEEIL